MRVSKLALLSVCVVALFALTGCFGGGGGSSASGSSYGSGSSYAGGSGSTSSGSSGGSTTSALPSNPEPATLALLGSGLAAYALMMRKRKR